MKKRLMSFKFAWEGLQSTYATQPNFRIHLACALVVIVAGKLTGLTAIEWCVMVISIGAVLGAELFNTAIETIVNVISPQYHPHAKIIKDASAGAVLVIAVSAFAIGCIIFIPKVLPDIL